MSSPPARQPQEQGIEVLWFPGADVPLIEGLSDAVVVAGEDNRVAYINRAAEALLGWSRSELVGEPLTTLVPGRLQHAHVEGFNRYVAGGAPRLVGRSAIAVRARHADGSEVPIELVLSALTVRSGGRLVVATLRDQRQRIELEPRTLVAEQLLEVLAGATPGPDVADRLVAAIGEGLGWSVAALWAREPGSGTIRCEALWHAPATAVPNLAEATFNQVLRPGACLPGRVLEGGESVWVAELADDAGFGRRQAAAADGLRSALAFPLRAKHGVLGVVELFRTEPAPRDESLLVDLVGIGTHLGHFLDRMEIERDRDRLLAEVQSAKRGQDFLLRASRVLAEAAGYAETLERLAVVAVPLLGDLCLIDVLDEDANLRRMVARHADPARQAAVDELGRDYPLDPEGSHPGVEVIRTGRSRWSADMSDEFLRLTTRDDHHFELVKALEFTSYMSVPLVAGERTLGAITLVSSGSGRRFGPSDLALVEELAAQVAAVVDKARLFDREHQVAHTLQRSLLPDRLPEVAGIMSAARYLPGSEGAAVGGDWYDVIPLADGRVGLAVGDVAGHDIGAASVMGQIRNALRAYAVQGLSPGPTVEQLNRFVEDLDLGRIATLLFAVFDPADGTLVLASAGHPPPVVVTGAARAHAVEVRNGPPIGVVAHAYPEIETTLGLGDSVLLYTDGLIEDRTTDVATGLKRLVDAARGAGGRDPAALCDTVLERTLPPAGRHDDVVILAVKRVAPRV